MILGLLGEKFSGKDTAANYLMKKPGWSSVRHSQILDEILEMFELPNSRQNEIGLGMALRAQFGEGILTRAVAKRVKELSGNVIINGIRFPEELAFAKSLGATVVYITAPVEIRFARYQTRGLKADDGVGTLEDFIQIEKQAATEVGIPVLARQADHTIINDSTLEDFYTNIDAIVK